MSKNKRIDAKTEPAVSPDKGVAVPAADTGLSNTRCETARDNRFNICIDYLKVRFNGTFTHDDPNFLELLDALKVNHDEFDQEKGVSGFAARFIYDENVVIVAGGKTTKSHDEETWLLELQGSACRDFENRKGDWKVLLGAIMKMPGGYFPTRIDAAIDDFSGKITQEQLKYRIYRHLYVTSLRRMVMEGETGLLVETDKPEIEISKNEGFTATFGGRSTKQLCIYNKKAERIANDYLVFVNSWLRYEARFYQEAARSAFVQVYTSMMDETFPDVVTGLIGGLVEFKENNDDLTACRNPTWSLWLDFLHEVSIIKVINQARKESTLAKKHMWFSIAAGPTLMKIYLAAPEEFPEFIGYVCFLAGQKIKNRDVASINYLRKRYGRDEIHFADALDNLEKSFGKYKELSPYLATLLRKFDFDTGEEVQAVAESASQEEQP